MWRVYTKIMYDLIKSEIEKIRNKYLNSAEEIVSGYNRECSLSKDYEGRQMFELLQNADDEATDSFGKVLITFDGNRLSVSNTGEPFSFKGIKSLLYPNASPKSIHANKIGCKGLGFRSILTWSNSITVATKDFTIQFSKEYAIEFLSSILDEKPELKTELIELSREEWPIAILTCPHLLEDSALIDGFSTSIIMECHEDLKDEIESQIEKLEFEELVFLPNLKEIEIICNDYHRIFYKVVDGDEVIIETVDKNLNETECASWRLYKKNGIIQDENHNNKDYEFIIAYDPLGEHQGEVLYSYFKTDVKLGFPALIHGTFELTSDRNSLQKQSIVNRKLIQILADFMIETAVNISKEQKECDYRPLSLVISSDLDIVLRNVFGLDELLRNKVRDISILPTINNEYISLNGNPKYSSDDFASVLNPSVFSSLLKMTDDNYIENFLKYDLKIRFYDYNTFCELINHDLKTYSMEDKVELIALVNSEYRYHSGEVFPHLLIDSAGNDICDAGKVYPFPNEEQLIALPEWVDIKFLNQEMEKLLCNKLSLGNSRRNLVSNLSRYNIEEYSFDRLLRGVVNQLDENLITCEKCSDILNWLWNYYNLEDRQAIPDIKVKVICRDGEIRYAKECYIGKEYGNELGERLVSLFSSNFVALKELNIPCEDVNSIADFLEWIGVSKYPRLFKKSLSHIEREEYIKSCFPLYVQRDNHWYSGNEFTNIKSVVVGFFENMDILLDKADFNDLLAWFILDEVIESRISINTEGKNQFSYIKGFPYKKIDERTVQPIHINSYLRFFLQNKNWIPNNNGVKKTPKYCCFEDNSLDPFIVVPNVDYTYIKNIVGRTCKKDVDAKLSQIGISDVFQEMDTRVVYQALSKLPELDPDCKKARSLYRKIIRDGLMPEVYKVNNPDYNAFIENGMVVAKKDGIKSYVPVKEVRYADKKVFSEEILKSFNMFDIDARSGEEKVKKLFGVKPLKYTNIEIEGEPIVHPCDDVFKKEYFRFLPFVYACRMGLKQASDDFRKLKTTKVNLCSKLIIMYKFGEQTKRAELQEYELVYLRKNNTAYICVPNKFLLFEELKQVFEFADAVAELITSILDVNEDKDFFRDLFRDTDLIREKKMRSDKNDDNLEMLFEARKRFNMEVNQRDEFWMTIAEVLKIPNVEISSYSANEMLNDLKLPLDIDKGVNYEDINCKENILILINIFKTLGIDIDKYNNIAVHSIDATKYWESVLRVKMQVYLKKYQAYLVEDLRDQVNCVELFDQYQEEYRFLAPSIPNSLFVDIDEIFEKECGVSFNTLNQFSDTAIDEIIKDEEKKLSDEDIKKLHSLYSQSKIEAYILFGKVDELLKSETVEEPIFENEQNNSDRLRDLVREVYNSSQEGFDYIDTKSINNSQPATNQFKQRKHSKIIHSETTDRKKQEIGIIGEVSVFKELQKIYHDVTWVSGNAEKAGYIIKGNDTCGYDIKYTDENGLIQYVEVKASRNEEITFCLSDSELRFGCQNASSYEIIYVVIGDDGLPVHKPWRLGHLFDFTEGEDLFNNERFSIESDSYSIIAKMVEKTDI